MITTTLASAFFFIGAIGQFGQVGAVGSQQPEKPLLLRYQQFDPLVSRPMVPLELTGEPQSRLAIVQLWDTPREEILQELRARGATVYRYLPEHAYVVLLPRSGERSLSGMGGVRWVGRYEPAFKIDPQVIELLSRGVLGTQRYNIQVLEKGAAMKGQVALRLMALGALVHEYDRGGSLMVATLSPSQLLSAAKIDEVFWIDLWSAPETDMDIAREIGGANFIESVEGFTGQGVRGEVMDGNVRDTHVDLRTPPLLFHGSRSGSSSHGTPTTGIVFGKGIGNRQGRGMLPDGQGIFADYDFARTIRYTHTMELLEAPYFAVFQSNSWGDARTRSYTNISFQMDEIIFDADFLICQSQSNAGTQDSRPQAWAKNIVSVGGVYHRNTLTKSDDAWSGGASIGPAADGRIKPDLTHFYDNIFTTSSSSDTSYTTGFGGTSGATPITAGHFGVMFQMWHKGVFGNFAPGHSVFEARPHFSTAKAIMINAADQYPFSGTGHDLTRVHQGWGMADLRILHGLRDNIFIVNEDVPLRLSESASWKLHVPNGQPMLRVTMVYADPPGTTSSTQHRINDLDLRVVSPTGTVYWGNNGLLEGNFSTPGGSPNTKDTVENVFIQNPSSGTWTVEVIAREINQDQHTETQQMDADFALVVSGILADSKPTSLNVIQGVVLGGDVNSLERSDDRYLRVEARRPQSVAEPSVDLVVSGFTQAPSVGALTVRVESATPTENGRVEQAVELYDFQANAWVEVDRRTPPEDDDAVVVQVQGSGAARFVGAGGEVRCRVKWFDRGVTVAGWAVRIDQVRWTVHPS
ncbi:MAG: S8 family serine peptidase [Armatimonadota bacterium]